MDGTAEDGLKEWMASECGGVEHDRAMGLLVPANIAQSALAFDQAFARFKGIVDIGKCKFKQGQVLNSATSKDMLIEHSSLILPAFVDFLEKFLDQDAMKEAGISYGAGGPDNTNMTKFGEGLDFRLRWIKAYEISDMVRATVTCPSIIELESTITKFKSYCETQDVDYSIVNFYQNIDRFGDTDRADETKPFGYVGLHFRFPITIDVESESITLVTEVQFHPATIYDGTPNCVKEALHPVYRRFHNGDTKKDPESIAEAKIARIAYEAYYAYALASTPN